MEENKEQPEQNDYSDIKKKYPNLKPCQPGEVRNTKGRGKGTLNFATIIRKWLGAKEEIMNPLSGKVQKLTQLDIMTLQQIKAARNGDLQAFIALADRVDGKPVQKQLHAGDPDPDAVPIKGETTVTKQVIIYGDREIEF